MTTEATEPTTTEATPGTESGGMPTRDELIAAVREAGGTESVDIAAEARDAGAEPPTAADVAAAAAKDGEPAAVDEPRIASILRSREKAAAERENARNLVEEMLSKAREESARLIEDARVRAREEADAERARLRAEFRANPTAMVRALGDPREITDAIMADDTPEARERARMRAELEATTKKADGVDELKKQIAELREEKQQEAHRARVSQVRDQFMATAAPEKAPYLNARYEPDEIFTKADTVARTWRNQGLELGKDFDFADITQYLESEAKKRIASLASPSRQVSEGAPPAKAEPGNAPKVPANGPRTLSAAQGSERRTSPKPLHQMTAAEQREAFIEEVAAARRANPDAVM